MSGCLLAIMNAFLANGQQRFVPNDHMPICIAVNTAAFQVSIFGTYIYF